MDITDAIRDVELENQKGVTDRREADEALLGENEEKVEEDLYPDDLEVEKAVTAALIGGMDARELAHRMIHGFMRAGVILVQAKECGVELIFLSRKAAEANKEALPF